MESRRKRNLELYSIALFSPSLQSINDFRSQLRDRIDYIVICHSEDDVKQYVHQNPDDSIVLIVSIEFAETLITQIHDLKQLHQIYVYHSTNAISQWTRSFRKMRLVKNAEDLLTALDANVKTKEKNGESFLKFFRLTTEIWYPTFIHLLLKLNRKNNDRQPFIDYLKGYYANNSTTLRDVFQFEREYSSTNAIQWYAKGSFVYSLLNKAFRSCDYEVLILFRFFIADLYDQLSSLHQNQTIPTDMIYYRGQCIRKEEIESLVKEQLICCTSFFSTTRNEKLASEFFTGASVVSRSPHDDPSVLFIIRSSSFHYKRLIFADISSLSEFSEQEVLFAVGSYFQIGGKWFEPSNNLWTVELEEMYNKLNEAALNQPFYIDLITIGFYLMVKDDDFRSVETFYQTLLKQDNSPLWILSCHVGLGLIECFKENYTIALEELWKAIEIIRVEEHCPILGNIYCILANVYREMTDDDMALTFYIEAKQHNSMKYFFEKTNYCFWEMFLYDDKFNSFVRNDFFFHYCDINLI